jgi:hypothetical protein
MPTTTNRQSTVILTQVPTGDRDSLIESIGLWGPSPITQLEVNELYSKTALKLHRKFKSSDKSITDDLLDLIDYGALSFGEVFLILIQGARMMSGHTLQFGLDDEEE